MAWDSNRKAPVRQLVREWLIYIAIVSLVFIAFFFDSVSPGTFIGLALSGPVYVGFGSLMAKFGYQRQRLLRRPTPKIQSAQPTPRHKPAATRRTGGKPNKGRR